ncbi:ketoacyl-ACP synthase III [Clostridium sp. D2Q-11]|uniref:Beta-ketoacyl-[acyl-carrier-protein] synthase III n=1 Tax=Anaeromonas frigoriresistens TaxID=2683708 RepID=A0A942UX79_9FIRM|nr:beta-ketoacyl-ACP synthase III [Anaeromonas frigoriresistens]MBS4539760.1 ketoacyl-ACP synthase III [Anaeromonas frigoriresistens]
MDNTEFGIGIIGTGSYIPDNILTNKELESIVDTSDEWITTRTGIKERRILDKSKATSYMAKIAGQRAIDASGLGSDDIDMIIVTTVTPDMAFPSTACIVQEKLGLKNAAAFDLEAACTGFIYGLSTGYSFIKSGLYQNVLVISADNLSKIIDWEDRNTCVLFGDGAGAVVLSKVESNKGIMSIKLGADGSGGDLLSQPAGGSLRPSTLETVKDKLHFIKMEGNSVFKFAVKTMVESSKQVMEESEVKIQEIDHLIPHQANMRIIESASKRLKIDLDKVQLNLEKYGNMSSASIPVALDEAVRSGKLHDNENVLLVGFGGGLTWGATLLKWKS